MKLLRYYVRRTGQAALTLGAAFTLVFLLLSALPGDAIANRAKDPAAALSPEAVATLRQYYGTDESLWRQYLDALSRLLVHGDLGISLQSGSSVAALIGKALPKTLALAGVALTVAIGLAGAIGLGANYARSRWTRVVLAATPSVLGSVPTFVVGALLIESLSFRFGLIPAVDDGSFVALLAPGLALGLLLTATIAQVFETSVQSAKGAEFAEVARLRGASERYLLARGVLRNASLPVLSLVALAVGELIGGAVITVTVFARNGIGTVLITAVQTQDLPVVQGVVLVSTAAYVGAALLVDAAYPLLDPRVKTLAAGRRPSRRAVRLAKAMAR